MLRYNYILYTMIEQTEMAQPRNVLLIALQLLQTIPDDNPALYNDIDNLVRTDFFYKSGEDLKTSYNWKKLEVIMHKHIPVVDEKWKEELVDIYIGK